jgi:hypothetical protein
MNQEIKIIFLGSPDFAVPCLKALNDDVHFKVLSVITQPDKPAGRGQDLTMPAVKKYALENGIEIWQPDKLKEVKDQLSEASPDFLVVVAYGKLVPGKHSIHTQTRLRQRPWLNSASLSRRSGSASSNTQWRRQDRGEHNANG